MKKSGILNAELSAGISRIGHTDTFVVADCGLPVPPGIPIIDLAVVMGVPAFFDVLDAILSEVVIEKSTIASEGEGSAFAAQFVERLPMPEYISHEALKAAMTSARFVVRTGEATPYANVILQSGVPFG
jgi:D-ribose pyranase